MKRDAREILNRARREGWAVGAFNAGNLETIKAVVGAAAELRAPVMIEASPGESIYLGLPELVSVVRILEHEQGVPVLLNLDHAVEPAAVRQALELGFDYVHFDGSKIAYEENVRLTKELASEAHERGALIEGEFDAITGTSADHTMEEAGSYQDRTLYTHPDRARSFVEQTGVDTLAVFVGNLHGIYRQEERLDLDRLVAIRAALPETFFSLHGGSGIAEGDIKAAIAAGVVKVNVNTELRLAFRDTLRQVLSTSDEVAIYRMMPPVVAAIQRVVEEKIRLFMDIPYS